jgi:hypothetical protein
MIVSDPSCRLVVAAGQVSRFEVVLESLKKGVRGVIAAVFNGPSVSSERWHLTSPSLPGV